MFVYIQLSFKKSRGLNDKLIISLLIPTKCLSTCATARDLSIRHLTVPQSRDYELQNAQKSS